MRKATLIIGLLALAIVALALGPSANAAEKARVALLVHVSAPPAIQTERLRTEVIQAVARGLEPVQDIELIAPGKVAVAAHRLDVGHRLTPPEVRALARALKADRIVLLRVTVKDRFVVAVGVEVFTAQAERIFALHTKGAARQLDRALAQAMRSLLEHLIPALLKL